MAARTLSDILKATRAAFIENISLKEWYEFDDTKTFDDQFSKSSFTYIITYVFSYCIWVYESIIFSKSDEIVATINTEHEFSIPWYKSLALAFQLGDSLVYNETTFKHDYSAIDESKQIVKYATIRQRQIEGVTKLQVFATKANKAAMTVDELSAFSGYFTPNGAAGTHFQFISLAPDNLILNLTVFYDPQILKSNGEKLSDGTKPVDIAIANYLNGIQYGGMFNRTKETEEILASDGVIDAVLANVYMNDDLKTDREFESPSGFFNAQTINVIYTASYEN